VDLLTEAGLKYIPGDLT